MKSLIFPQKSDKDGKRRGDWVDSVGVWRYYSLVLAGFEPIKARQIYHEATAAEIAEAICSQAAFKYESPQTKP